MPSNETKSGVAYPRGWGAQVACDDGTEETVSNGLNLRVPPLARVTLAKDRSRWVIFQRPR